MNEVLRKWYWERKALGSTINVLSVALYDLFGAEGERLFCLPSAFPYLLIRRELGDPSYRVL